MSRDFSDRRGATAPEAERTSLPRTASGAAPTSLRTGFGIGRAFGVELRVDWSLLIIFALIAVNLGAGVFAAWHPEWNAGTRWGLALVASVLFFASVLVHELSHAVVAQMWGLEVRRITLFLFGGLAQLDGEPESPTAELTMAIVGPVTSLVIGIVATVWGMALAGQSFHTSLLIADLDAQQAALASLSPFATMLLWLGPINVILAVFNMIPGFPLDGGRVLRAILWTFTRDLTRATRWASGVGRAFAWVLMALGVMSFFGGAFGQGIWLLLIGWFLNNAARASYEQLLVRSALTDVSVSRVMRATLDRVPTTLTVEELVRDHIMAGDQQAFPVEDDGALRGLVCFDDVRRVPQARWGEVTVREIMTPLASLTSLPPTATAEEALDALAKRDVDQVPILSGDHLLGLVRRRDLMRFIALSQANGLAARA